MKASAARKLLEQITDVEVGRVIFGPFHVQVEFLGVHNLFLRLNRSFEVVRGADQHSFEPEVLSVQPAASFLAACVGSKLTGLELEANLLTVSFANTTMLYVPLAGANFEPIEISCCHHLSPNKLEWLTTVEAG